MKKILILFFTLFAGTFYALADNTLSVSSALIAQGKSGSFNIELTNTDVFLAYQMDLTLPTGITYESATLGDRYSNHGLGEATHGQTTTFTLNSSTNADITGNNGALLTITVAAAEGLEVGSKLTATISNIELIQKDGESGRIQVHPDPIDFEIEITDRIVLDENSTIPLSVQNGVNVLVKRSLKKDVWNTIVLPFTMTKDKAQTAFGTDVELADFDSYEIDYGEDEENVTPLGIVINFKKYNLAAKTPMTGGRPFLIKVSKEIESFTVDDVNIVNSVSETVKTDKNYSLNGKFTGSFVATNIPEDGLFISDNKFWYSTGKTKVKGFRCWFMLGAVLNKATSFSSRIRLNVNDNQVDGITEAQANKKTDSRYFDLQGQQVSHPRKGIYITDGKKMYVK